MRITNVRRGRIIRITAIAAVLLILIYALHSYSYANVDSNSNEIVLTGDKLSYYKSHRDVYPKLETGKL